VQLAQIGWSQVPDRRVGTFQSQSRSARLPQRTQRFLLPLEQTVARVPFSRATVAQIMRLSLRHGGCRSGSARCRAGPSSGAGRRRRSWPASSG